MAKQIAKLLRADIQDSSDLKSIAKMLSGKGRGNDTMLAHITPREMKILKAAGGSGTVNPDTGLVEFDDSDVLNYGFDAPPTAEFGGPPAQSAMYETAAPAPDAFANPVAADAGYAGAPVQTFDATQTAPAAPPVAAEPVGQTFAGVPAGAGAEYVPVPAAAPASEKSFLQQYVGDPLKSLKETTGLSSADLLRLGLAGGGALAGRSQSQKAAQQIQQSIQEQKNIGQPYQKTGQELQRAAMAGEMTPQSQQAYQALQAQLAQGAASRGGVGVAQSQAQLEAFRQNLLQNQYNYGLQVSQIGDSIALGAIKTGMQLDQQLAQANQAFYTQLAAIAGGGTYAQQTPRGQ
jgi:hypothetical protein